MSDLRQAAQQALEALNELRLAVYNIDGEHVIGGCFAVDCADKAEEAVTALRAALAQQEQEPVAWRHKGAGHFSVTPLVSKFPEWEPLYTAPPRREWQGLTEKEINDGRDQLPTEDLCGWSFRQGVYFAEKALKERNNG